MDAPRAGALAALPFVGIALGAISGACGLLASRFVPVPLAVAIASALGIILTGAIHLDGFLDCCDALIASVPPERRLEILKDPRHGTFALAGLAAIVPIWLTALAAVPPLAWPWVLAFCAGSARAAAVLNAYRVPYARGGASARAFDQRPSRVWLVAGMLASAACCALHPTVALLLVAAALLALALGRWCASRLAGALVGDCYGAIIVVVEVSLLTGVAALTTRFAL